MNKIFQNENRNICVESNDQYYVHFKKAALKIQIDYVINLLNHSTNKKFKQIWFRLFKKMSIIYIDNLISTSEMEFLELIVNDSAMGMNK